MEGYGAPPRTGSRPPHTEPTEHPESSPVYPMSPLLLERLQRSRRIENDRVSSQSSTDRLSSSAGSRHVRSPSPTNSHRPGSSGGLDPTKAKKGLGVKEMEQTVSTLHKQNFDLKLELYHRRERQTALEERLDALEREAKERDELNDSLVHELEKRDKAVEEAIAMILTLEKRVEQLLLERNMVRQVEAEAPAYPRIDSPAVTPASKNPRLGSSPYADAKTPVRMPSFVSDRGEKTENLRTVYLGTLAGDSALTLPRMADDTPDTARIDPRLASPALSELSESSFVSVYGRGRPANPSSPPGNTPSLWDRSPKTPVPARDSPTRARTSTPSRQQRPSSSRATSGQFHNIGDVLEVVSSPRRQPEKTKLTQATMSDSPRPPTANNQTSPFARPPPTNGQAKTKQEKREALGRVYTQGQFSSPQALPPTPDTLSTTTTLSRNETPPKERNPENERSFLCLTETNTSRASGYDEQKSPSRAAQPGSAPAFDNRKHHTASATPEARSPRPAAEAATTRARDGHGWGGETSKYRPSHRRDSTNSSVDTWLRESLKPEGMDALDPTSSISQAHGSAKKGRASPDLFSFPTSTSGWATHAMFGARGGKGHKGSGSKQVPVTPTADMLDAIGTSVPTPPRPGTGRMTPVHGAAVPPPPNRRSSLLARTGPAADAMPGTESIPQSPPLSSAPPQANSPARGSRARSNSTDIRYPAHYPTELGMKQSRAMTVPPKQVHAPPPPKQQPLQETPGRQDTPTQPLPKQRHYPPQTMTSRPRSRGLNTFFRRSTGSADVPTPPASAPPMQSAFKPPPPAPAPPTQSGTGNATATTTGGMGIAMGMPSWVRRGSLPDQDRTSATPPPILRNKAVSPPSGGAAEEEDADGGVQLESSPGGGVPVGVVLPAGKPASRKSWGGSSSGGGEGGDGGGVSLGGASAGGGGKRKWLGLGRVASLRNRGGA
ncbi:hypothetical protein B0I37DRAFT_156135 [Chaetomium sp. MPI-CAGE-AT-0009]|nr:hypothetical protein B0I37DRAFT_156135 [Chaetomium sp. MPI-CAGE-AT-0009]